MERGGTHPARPCKEHPPMTTPFQPAAITASFFASQVYAHIGL